MLSNRRANDEIGQWLEDDEKRSDLLGGTGKVLLSHNDKYLDQTVLICNLDIVNVQAMS